MKIDYINYTAKQLLQDKLFLQSLWNPTDSSIHFWNELQEKNSKLSNEINRARIIAEKRLYNKAILSRNAENELWERITHTNKQRERKSKQILYYLSSAACIALLIAGTWIFHLNSTDTLFEIEKVKSPVNITNDIQLILANKEEITLTEKEPLLQYDNMGKLRVNSQKIIVQKKSIQQEEKITYNQLIVPAGKRSMLELSDGTHLYVNAGTRVVYPVVFEKEKREIYVDGEIYLDVRPEKNRLFIVKTNKLDVNVLGTSFNVSAYEEDKQISVVLVTGKVHVKTKDKQENTLKPNEMYSYANGKSQIKRVNAAHYISWKDGAYAFDNESFSIVLKKLSRYYGRKIIWDKKIHSMNCSGTLNLKDNIMEVLQGLESTVPVLFTEEAESIKVNVKP